MIRSALTIRGGLRLVGAGVLLAAANYTSLTSVVILTVAVSWGALGAMIVVLAVIRRLAATRRTEQ